jgi:hypothetical protein
VWCRQQKEPADCFMTYIYLCGSITSSSLPFLAPIDPSLTLFFSIENEIYTYTYMCAGRKKKKMRGKDEMFLVKIVCNLEIQSAKIICNLLSHFCECIPGLHVCWALPHFDAI